jgi:hypothetical protein
MTGPHRRHPGYEPTDPPPRKVMGVEIRAKREEQAIPDSISPRGALSFAARYGRSWSPLGVAIMVLLIWAGLIGGILYTLNSDAGQALIAAWRANTAEMAGLRKELAAESAARLKTDAKVDAILEQLRINGKSDATQRIVRLENNDRITGQFIVELNGTKPNDSFPGTLKGDFQSPPEAPVPVFPLFKTKQQWALKPE